MRGIKRSTFPCPMVIRDHLDDMKSMADGKIYTSKRSYYRSLKEKNLEIVDKPEIKETNRPQKVSPGLGETIKRVIENG